MDPIILREVDKNKERPSDKDNEYDNYDSIIWDLIGNACEHIKK